jgi:hypothetical protein
MPKTVFHGVSINWGVNTTISGITGLMQTREHSFHANSELILDGGDTPVSKVWWGMYEEATFTYVATEYSNNSGNAQYYLPDIGDIVYLSDTVNTQLGGLPWFVDNITTHTGNTTATRVTLKLSRYPQIATI